MLALWIIALHMFGDYVVQTHWIAMGKLDSWKVRTVHVALYSAPFAVLAAYLGGTWQPWAFPLLVAIPHWLTDSVRWCPGHPWNLKALMVDQSIHLLCLAAAGSTCYGLT